MNPDLESVAKKLISPITHSRSFLSYLEMNFPTIRRNKKVSKMPMLTPIPKRTATTSEGTPSTVVA